LFGVLSDNPLWLNAAVLLGAALLLLPAGSRLAATAEALGEKTGVGNTFAGLIFLAGATSLPEVVIVVAGSSIGNASLVLNDLFGGIACRSWPWFSRTPSSPAVLRLPSSHRSRSFSSRGSASWSCSRSRRSR